MPDYTYTSEVIADGYARSYYADHNYNMAVEGFYRWLASVKAEAWDEGFLLATRNNPTKPHPMLRMNPYREEQ